MLGDFSLLPSKEINFSNLLPIEGIELKLLKAFYTACEHFNSRFLILKEQIIHFIL